MLSGKLDKSVKLVPLATNRIWQGRGLSNWYYLPVRTPFTQRDLIGTGRIELEILGKDGVFSQDEKEGSPKIFL